MRNVSPSLSTVGSASPSPRDQVTFPYPPPPLFVLSKGGGSETYPAVKVAVKLIDPYSKSQSYPRSTPSYTNTAPRFNPYLINGSKLILHSKRYAYSKMYPNVPQPQLVNYLGKAVGYILDNPRCSLVVTNCWSSTWHWEGGASGRATAAHGSTWGGEPAQRSGRLPPRAGLARAGGWSCASVLLLLL